MHMYFTRAVNHRQNITGTRDLKNVTRFTRFIFSKWEQKCCIRWAECFCTFIIKAFFCLMIIYHLLTESEVITGKSLRFPSNDRMDEVNKLFIIWPF